ncbi:chaperone modulator CbpM [Sneathiella sp.]|uniref:chaperone modulator CbpM n=1 Tax=Sneathiella sp. TaxID=1964365 RepID=UPI002FE40B8C
MISEQEVLRQLTGVSLTRLRIWVKRGWVIPEETEAGYHFREIDMARLELIRQLKVDLAVNNEAIPIVLSLIDQIHGLRFELKSLARAIETQHEDVRAAILRACSDARAGSDPL